MHLKIGGRPGQFPEAFQGMVDPLDRAAAAAMRDARQEILDGGRANIAAAGFSRRWQDGLTATITGTGLRSSLRARHRRGFATVFETGRTISAKRGLIWLPLPTVPKKIGSNAQMTPRNFVRLIGPLFTMRVPGKGPLLGAYMQGLAGSKVNLAKLRRGAALARLGVRGRGGQRRASKGVVATPVFHGVSSVTIRKRWDLRGVYDRAQQGISANFAKRLREG
jgi:hypothetical protein